MDKLLTLYLPSIMYPHYELENMPHVFDFNYSLMQAGNANSFYTMEILWQSNYLNYIVKVFDDDVIIIKIFRDSNTSETEVHINL